MLHPALIALAAFLYLGALFAVAAYAERRAVQGRSIVQNPYIYALSLTVFVTAWTFYGSVGRAAMEGLDFVALYIGATLIAILWWLILRKIIRISKRQRLSTIADFLSARYGNSSLLAGLVAFLTFVVLTPYIALQLKAISLSYQVLIADPGGPFPDPLTPPPRLRAIQRFMSLYC
ncbi:hypothetical protein CAI21_20850 [Alkalilimnicola ehrlichii]|uniref:Uncharacterized protein n=1 Tax=Alkalilimnicola ehrlichii TaxID=351052 RepID=A0A3E0WLS2_9GAMM|nr:hypothetical protein [Alkalilimnicola ehrlichii]RFA24664.1 hypothetical protein CAI21_20850 [Alkalilimnicola ehrlichii]RFA33758.1 hypothetical protein CAL65_16565 [Alkalilimnicola ehrlichii]